MHIDELAVLGELARDFDYLPVMAIGGGEIGHRNVNILCGSCGGLAPYGAGTVHCGPLLVGEPCVSEDENERVLEL